MTNSKSPILFGAFSSGAIFGYLLLLIAVNLVGLDLSEFKRSNSKIDLRIPVILVTSGISGTSALLLAKRMMRGPL